MIATDTTWTVRERSAWRLPERLTVSDWAERYRVLDPVSCPGAPGPWRNERTPYLRGIMDAFCDPRISEITVQCCAQVGKTEACLNILGYIIDQDPAPLLWVLPRGEDADEFGKHRLSDAIDACPQLVKHKTGKTYDETKKGIRFDRMAVHLTGAGTAAGLAQLAIRYVIFDETNKYTEFTGKEADPIKLGRERTQTVWNRKIIKTSTPTVPGGYITAEFEMSDMRRFWVKCPHCQQAQTLNLGQIKRPPDCHSADELQRKRLAWYECKECGKAITEQQKGALAASGEWRAEHPEIKGHAGFHLSRLYSLWHGWSDILAEFWRSERSIAAMMNFVNSWLGEPWEEQIHSTDARKLYKKAQGESYSFNPIPEAIQLVTLGADVQERLIYFTIVGWAVGQESWRLRWGAMHGFNEIREMLAMPWRTESGRELPIRFGYMDSGYRTDEVYEFCQQCLPQLAPSKGEDKQKSPVWESKLAGSGIVLAHIDTTYFKDWLFRLINTSADAPGYWHLRHDIDEDYCRQLCAEHKVIRRPRMGKEKQVWMLKSAGMANHYLDCEVLALAAAYQMGLTYMQPLAQQEAEKDQREEEAQERKGTFIWGKDRKPGRWI